MKVPALLIGSAMFMSLFMFSTLPIFDNVDRLVSDMGAGWEEETRVTDGRMPAYDPVVKDDGNGNTHIIWTGEDTGTKQLYYAKYDGNGNVIVPSTRITKNNAPSGAADMAVGDDGVVTIVYVDGTEGNWNIFYKQLNQDGLEVMPATQVSQIPIGSTVSGIINNWGGPGSTTVDEQGPEASQTIQTLTGLKDMGTFSPSVSIDKYGNAHMVWADSRSGNFDLYYSVIDPAGEAEVSELRLTETSGSSTRPMTAMAPDGSLSVVWEEARGDVTRIEHMLLGRSHIKLAETRLVTTTGKDLVKDMAMDGDGIMHMVWSDEKSGAIQVRYKSFDMAGRTLFPETAITPPGSECGNPTVAVDEDLVHVVFTHGIGTTGNEIYYRTIGLEDWNVSAAVKLVPNAWGAHDLDLDWAPESVDRATGKVDGRLRLAWADCRDGNDDIYLTHAETHYIIDIESSVVETGTETTTHPATIMAASGLFALGLAFTTDIGKWAIGATFLPMYTRLKRTRILDQSVRDEIFNRIMNDPGVNFTGLMKALKLKNGVLSYHLSTLEREEYIISRRDGIYRRYYPRTNGYCKAPKELHEMIVDTIFERPGITQSKLAKELKKSRQVINYHIKQLITSGTIKIERHGRQTKCYVSNWAV